MIKLYKWLYKNQRILIKEIEKITKIRTFDSFISIGNLPDALGLYRPEAIMFDGEPVDSIILNDRIFFEGDKHILKILGHEVLHSIEKIVDKMAYNHPPKFREWEKTLNDWIDSNTFKPMPKISFDRGSYFTRAKGISKFKTYECSCGTTLYNMQELNIQCNKCGHQFFLINDGSEDFEDARRSRASPLLYTAQKLAGATDTQIINNAPYGLSRKLLEICEPKSAPTVTKAILSDTDTKAMLQKLYQTAINFGALEGAKIDNIQTRRIAYLLKG